MRVRHLFLLVQLRLSLNSHLIATVVTAMTHRWLWGYFPLRAPTVFRTRSPAFQKLFPDLPRTGTFYRNRSEYSNWPLVHLWTGSYCFRQPCNLKWEPADMLQTAGISHHFIKSFENKSRDNQHKGIYKIVYDYDGNWYCKYSKKT